MSVCIAFDTAAAFAMSFGISKFALAQVEAKLVGEIGMPWKITEPCNRSSHQEMATYLHLEAAPGIHRNDLSLIHI